MKFRVHRRPRPFKFFSRFHRKYVISFPITERYDIKIENYEHGASHYQVKLTWTAVSTSEEFGSGCLLHTVHKKTWKYVELSSAIRRLQGCVSLYGKPSTVWVLGYFVAPDDLTKELREYQKAAHQPPQEKAVPTS